MKSIAKWFVAGGAFLIIIGFFLPVTILITQTSSADFSLFRVSRVGVWFFLYLVPIGALLTLILSLVPANNQLMKDIFLAGQISGLTLGSLLLIGGFFFFLIQPEKLRDPQNLGSLLPQEFLDTVFDIWPSIGFVVLLVGFGLAIFGLIASKFQFTKKIYESPPVPMQEVPVSQPPPVQQFEYFSGNPRLEINGGKLANQVISITGSDFSIGRGRDNHLQLPDPDRTISRVHAKLRYAQGAWFIQDQGSKIGTFVNRKKIKATRIKSGDEIKIGNNSFIFHE